MSLQLGRRWRAVVKGELCSQVDFRARHDADVKELKPSQSGGQARCPLQAGTDAGSSLHLCTRLGWHVPLRGFSGSQGGGAPCPALSSEALRVA